MSLKPSIVDRVLPWWAWQIGPEYWQTYPYGEPDVKEAIGEVDLPGQVEEVLCPLTRWVSNSSTAVTVQAKTKAKRSFSSALLAPSWGDGITHVARGFRRPPETPSGRGAF